MIHFGIANSADPDEMSHNAAFDLGLQCLSYTSLGVFDTKKVYQLLGGEILRHVGVPEFLH